MVMMICNNILKLYLKCIRMMANIYTALEKSKRNQQFLLIYYLSICVRIIQNLISLNKLLTFLPNFKYRHCRLDNLFAENDSWSKKIIQYNNKQYNTY